MSLRRLQYFKIISGYFVNSYINAKRQHSTYPCFGIERLKSCLIFTWRKIVKNLIKRQLSGGSVTWKTQLADYAQNWIAKWRYCILKYYYNHTLKIRNTKSYKFFYVLSICVDNMRFIIYVQRHKNKTIERFILNHQITRREILRI